FVYTPITEYATSQAGDFYGSLSTGGFFVQMLGRALGWALAGMAMGLGQGIALRSKRLLLYGFIGGVIGGILGGLLFDPIDLILLGTIKPSAHMSRVIGIMIVGGCVGAMIGVVELLARDAWLRMIKGPLAGKEFLVFKDVMNIGSSPKCEIYLFNDPKVSDVHASLRASGDDFIIQGLAEEEPVLLNERPVWNTRLHHGDQITIGRTVFIYQKRKG
ncbi:FHA domain-containing protein, partial [Acidobacteriota bacterium]